VERALAQHRAGWQAAERLFVVAAGKAAGRMAAAAARVLGGALDGGLVVSPHATPVPAGLALQLAGHPLPDARSLVAAARLEALLRGLTQRDMLLLLLSGGASALLAAPAAGLRLSDKQVTTALLQRAGADIGELNTVRKHLSRLKGGQLARAAAPARVLALVLSDVVGDDLSVIASGPSVADPTRYADAIAVLERHRLAARVPRRVWQHLQAGASGACADTPKPGDACFRRVTTKLVGSNRRSLAAAVASARRLGLRPRLLSAGLAGEAREVARVLCALLPEQPRRVTCLLAGGETTVTVRGSGRGGRNQEMAVAAALALAGRPGAAVFASLATDGKDGNTAAAGGVADDCSVERARRLGLPPATAFLARSDSHGFLAGLGDLVVTGPTGTNVMDLTLLLAAR
jgi:hydroxypyruvate reductase